MTTPDDKQQTLEALIERLAETLEWYAEFDARPERAEKALEEVAEWQKWKEGRE